MKTLIIAVINHYGYLGIFLLIALENIFPPIPSELILTFGGFATTISHLKLEGVVLSATLGSVLGAIILYWIGRMLSPERLASLINSRLGKRLKLKQKHITMSQSWFNKHGYKTVFFCRFIPILRSLISIPAGSQRMNFSAFLMLTAIGTAIWNFVLVYLGQLAGSAWESIALYIDLYGLLIAIILMVAASIGTYHYLKKTGFKSL